MPLPGVLSIAGILAWAGYELVLRRRDSSAASTWQAGAEDHGSTRLLLLAYVGSAAIVMVSPATSAGWVAPSWRWIGVAVIAAGLALRAWSMATLGRFYTRTLRTVGDQRVVRTGPYRLIRHPGYAGSLLVWSGYALGLGNWVSTVLVSVVLLATYSWRIHAEERLLVGTFGDEYAAYRRTTRRLLPFVY